MRIWLQNDGVEVFAGVLICLFFWLSDFYVAHMSGYTIRESVAQVRNLSAVSFRTGVAKRSTASTGGQ